LPASRPRRSSRLTRPGCAICRWDLAAVRPCSPLPFAHRVLADAGARDRRDQRQLSVVVAQRSPQEGDRRDACGEATVAK
jgi:hypothetical protein